MPNNNVRHDSEPESSRADTAPNESASPAPPPKDMPPADEEPELLGIMELRPFPTVEARVQFFGTLLFPVVPLALLFFGLQGLPLATTAKGFICDAQGEACWESFYTAPPPYCSRLPSGLRQGFQRNSRGTGWTRRLGKNQSYRLSDRRLASTSRVHGICPSHAQLRRRHGLDARSYMLSLLTLISTTEISFRATVATSATFPQSFVLRFFAWSRPSPLRQRTTTHFCPSRSSSRGKEL
ncbi:hypothetical protein IWX49DRAFT_586043, partial [Phyllosticta citricarpa]